MIGITKEESSFAEYKSFERILHLLVPGINFFIWIGEISIKTQRISSRISAARTQSLWNFVKDHSADFIGNSRTVLHHQKQGNIPGALYIVGQTKVGRGLGDFAIFINLGDFLNISLKL